MFCTFHLYVSEPEMGHVLSQFSIRVNTKMIRVLLTLLSLPTLFQLLTIFVSAKLAAYVKFYQNNKDFIDSLGK